MLGAKELAGEYMSWKEKAVDYLHKSGWVCARGYVYFKEGFGTNSEIKAMLWQAKFFEDG